MFEWNQQYSVGIIQIDDEHRKLLRLMKELHDAAKQGKARAAVTKVLEGVVAYTVQHFGNEEQLMRRHGYEGLAAHKRIHDALVTKANELLRKAKHEDLSITMDVMSFLDSWISHHISETDKQVGKFLQSKGVK